MHACMHAHLCTYVSVACRRRGGGAAAPAAMSEFVELRQPVRAKRLEQGSDRSGALRFGAASMQGWREDMEDPGGRARSRRPAHP